MLFKQKSGGAFFTIGQLIAKGKRINGKSVWRQTDVDGVREEAKWDYYSIAVVSPEHFAASQKVRSSRRRSERRRERSYTFVSTVG